MYAIIRTGGKQYRVKAGDTVRVEKLKKDPGTEFELPEVLFVGGKEPYFGAPVVENAKVTAVVTQQARASKIVVFKKKRRQGYRKTQGHRQYFTELFIKSITDPSGETEKAPREAPVVDPAKREARLQKMKEERQAKSKEPAPATKKKAPASKKKAKKKVAKKKKVTKKKSTSAKKTTKKKTAAKKKTTKKKTT